MNEGPEALASYVTKVKAVAGPSSDRIRGFRYITQDDAPGASNPMSQQPFVDSLQWLAKIGYSHDFVVDSKNFGIQALQDVADCLTRVATGLEEGSQAKFVIGAILRP